jgi:hypothetical protein
VFINGVAKPNIRAKDIAADDVALVEVSNHPGYMEYRDGQIFRNNGQDCGVGRVVETYGEGNRKFSLSRPPKANVVSFIHIWLK